MNDDLKALYRELGYTGPLPETRRTRGRATAPPSKEQQDDLPPLDEQSLKLIEEQLKTNREETLTQIRELEYGNLEDDFILEILSQARTAFDKPAKFVEELRAKRSRSSGEKRDRRTRGLFDKAPEVPPELILYPDIPIDPNDHKFEPRADALGWAFNSVYYIVRDKVDPDHPIAEFPLHSDYQNNFVYDLKNKEGKIAEPDEELAIALFADFGTGLYHSKYIARNIVAMKPDYAIHLGDVYYAGRDTEFKFNFREPLDPVLETSRLFAMNANHEMFSSGFPYFGYINYKLGRKSGWVEQEQQGSYFAIRNKKYQIIGIDTAYHEDGRHKEKELNDWLWERLQEGRTADLTNIFLSPNEPYELGKDEFSNLYSDLQKFVDAKLIDFWFWGNTHYCALFEKSKKAPFFGSCIGHGGHPIYKEDVEENAAKHEKLKNKDIPPPMWVDTSPKFPEETGLRPDLANHGFCMMHLRPKSVRLTYYDWLKKERYSAEFSTATD